MKSDHSTPRESAPGRSRRRNARTSRGQGGAAGATGTRTVRRKRNGGGRDAWRLLAEGQSEVLGLIAGGASLERALDGLARVVERAFAPALCSIQLLDDEGTWFRHHAGPNLPHGYRRAIEAAEVRPGTASFGAAVRNSKPAISADVATDPLWRNLRDVALRHDLHACWSFPLCGKNGKAAGVLSLYHARPCKPSADERRMIEFVLPLANVILEHEKCTQALHNADERFTSLASSVPGVVYQRLVTPDGHIRYTYISEGTRDLFGVEPEEIIANPQALFDCHGPSYRATFRDRLLEASRKLTMWDVEAEIISRDGERKFTHAIARPHRLPDGSVLWDGLILDATRIKEAEMTAAAAEAQTRQAIIESISQGLVLYGPNDRLVTCNGRYMDMYQHDKEVVAPGANYATLARLEAEREFPREEGGSTDERLKRRMQQHGEPYSAIERRLLNGRWVLVNEHRATDGGTVALHTDITDLKHREEELGEAKDLAESAKAELEEANRQLDIALENMTQGLNLFDIDEKLVLSNRRYAEIFRLPRESVRPGMEVRELLKLMLNRLSKHDKDLEELLDDCLDHVTSRERHTFYLRLKDGHIIEVIHQPLPDGGSVETFTDVTNRERTEERLRRNEERMRERVLELLETRQRLERQSRELQLLAETLARARDEAEAANRSKSEFLANMSHELRTPLNAIIGFSEAMSSELFGQLGDPRYRDYAQGIQESGTHLLELINDILDLSKVEAGELKLHEETVCIQEVLAACRRFIQERAMKASVALTFDDARNYPPIRADEIKLKQILLNLLSNAVKFTPPCGEVRVSVSRTEDGGIEISVSDTGIGIDKDDLPYILQPFRQVESADSRKHSGTGLGLPLVKALVERHEGRFALQSAVGVGTTATVQLPAFRVIETATLPLTADLAAGR